MKSIEIYIPVKSVPKGRPRVTFKGGKAIAYTPRRTRQHALAVGGYIRLEANKQNWKVVMKPAAVRVYLDFYITETRRRVLTDPPDLPNYVMQLCDIISGILIEDDAQICEMVTRKITTKISMIRVQVEVIGDGT